jgi:hypothetical protein
VTSPLRSYGQLIDRDTARPLSFAVVRAYEARTGTEIRRTVADEYGRYYLLVPPGNYVVQVDERLDEKGNYRLIYSSDPIMAKRGIIKNKLKI